MFDHVGKKLMGLAKLLAWIGIIASFIGGAAVAFMDGDFEIEMIIAGLAVAAGGALGSWLLSLGLYSYGELVENADIMAKLLQKHDRM